MRMFESPIVCDATVLSNFAFTDDLNLLDTLPASCVTVEAVNEELRAGISAYPELERAVDAIEVLTDHEPTNAIRSVLDRGEAHALQAAIDQDGTLATDDRQARTHANDRSVPLTGSVGILLRLVEQNELTVADADAILQHWITEYHYHSPIEHIHEAIDSSEEET